MDKEKVIYCDWCGLEITGAHVWLSSEVRICGTCFKPSSISEHNCKYKELMERFEKVLGKLSSSAAQRYWAELKQELDL